MFFEISILSFFFFAVIGVPQYSPIGNYSHVIQDYTQLCGISRNTLRDESNCFEYHRDFDSKLEGARGMHFGEAPWTVIVTKRNEVPGALWSEHIGECSGVLISYQWVLTAAHCLTSDFNRVYFNFENFDAEEGDYIDSVGKGIKHPEYVKGDPEHDIGLIKLEKSFSIHHNESNFICLPPGNFTITGKKIGMRSGWSPDYTHVHIGPVTFQMARHKVRLSVVKFSVIPGGSFTCPGDSGSPIWKYHMGRAYLISTHKGGQSIAEHRCSNRVGYGVFVPSQIDWIMETISK